jgi:hypothetical protein
MCKVANTVLAALFGFGGALPAVAGVTPDLQQQIRASTFEVVLGTWQSELRRRERPTEKKTSSLSVSLRAARVTQKGGQEQTSRAGRQLTI